jgi:hypothetical protein
VSDRDRLSTGVDGLDAVLDGDDAERAGRGTAIPRIPPAELTCRSGAVRLL